MRELYSKEGFVSTVLANKVITVTWEKLFNAQTIYDSCNAQLEAVQNGDAEAIILDIQHAEGTPPMECQDWFGSTLFPGFAKNPNFKGIVNVMPEGIITKMGANKWKKTAESGMFGFSIFETDSVAAAQELVSNLEVMA